jgi:hypothetical protein
VGGAGVYRGTKAHGPFLHVDVRGDRVRWAFEDPPHRARRKSKKPAGAKPVVAPARPASGESGSPATSTP